MHLRRSFVALAFVAAALVALPLAAQETPAPGGPHRHAGGMPVYDVAAEKVVEGKVAELLPQACGCGGLHLKLETADGPLEIGLGPAAFLGELGVTFNAGDDVAVTGAAPKGEARAEFLARSVRLNDKTFELRDAEGKPRWSMAGMNCPMHRKGSDA
ncbi:MAG: hypothetical protein F9K16_07115 [Thermoanaerobaculia bacterium]|nr:MAG: hypothetical protein F9K16_07115 [Thermoanaerobaculia bacterium]MBZ0101307.1 hypothetical protein [Thermoanaerobaculia bacterium]